jgi:hypothetical protein
MNDRLRSRTAWIHCSDEENVISNSSVTGQDRDNGWIRCTATFNPRSIERLTMRRSSFVLLRRRPRASPCTEGAGNPYRPEQKTRLPAATVWTHSPSPRPERSEQHRSGIDR